MLPELAVVVLLADRGFADGKFMKYLNKNLGWHFRIRIKRSFAFSHEGQWRKIATVQVQPGQAWFTDVVSGQIEKLGEYNYTACFLHTSTNCLYVLA